MFAFAFGVIAVVAGEAVGLPHAGWMTLAARSPAVRNAASALVCGGLRMRKIETCLIPIESVMTCGAVRPERSRMEGWVGMARGAG